MICVNEKNSSSSCSYIKILLSQTLVKSSQKNTVGLQFIAMQNGEFLIGFETMSVCMVVMVEMWLQPKI
jgi:hypothetical protein